MNQSEHNSERQENQVNLAQAKPDRDSWIENDHRFEWEQGSGVDPDIVTLNVRTLDDLAIDESSREVSAPIADLLNWKFTRFGYQVKQSIRGWWVNGVDPLNDFKPMEWGRFKPDIPFSDRKKNKPQKYASPYAVSSRATFLDVPDRLWQLVSFKSGIAISGSSFWQWVLECNVPVTLCEGEKKAGCLLSLGYAAIALPGFRSAARSKDKAGNPLLKPILIPDVELFATPDRVVNIFFDYETNQKTARDIRSETKKLCRLLSGSKADPKVITLPGPEKGADDFAVARGGAAFGKLYEQALPPSQWQTSIYKQLTHEVAVRLNQRYLGTLNPPDTAKLIGVKSPKGSGKTEALIGVVEQAMARGQRVLLLTHRVQLGQAICDRVYIPYVTELRRSEEGDLFGYGLCIDSLHPESQAQFDAGDWEDAIVIVDEAEQVFWHLLSANTEVSKHRITILRQLRQLFQQTLASPNGKVILMDADLTDVSIKFVLKTAEAELWVKPWIIVNDWKDPNQRVCYHYSQSNPQAWYTALNEAVDDGDRLFVTTHSQKVKSTWSAINIEKDILKRHPNKKILRVDSDTISDPSHPAYGWISSTSQFNNLRKELGDSPEVRPNDEAWEAKRVEYERLRDDLFGYDVIVATPSIETGVSIDIRDHFDSVWGCFWGVSGVTATQQPLARVRDDCDRHVWAARYGVGSVGNGSASKYSLIQSQAKVAQANISQLRRSGWTFEEDEFKTNDAALNAWAEMACRLNSEMFSYRDSLIEALTQEGYDIQDPSAIVDTDIVNSLISTRDEGYQEEKQGIADDELVSDSKGEELKGKKSRTKADRYQLRKWALWKRYGIPVDADLVRKDDDGWHPQLRLHYFLTIGSAFSDHREQQSATSAVTGGEIWYPSFNRNQLSARLRFLEAVNHQALCDPAELYSADHPAVLHAAKVCKQDTWATKAIAGFGVREDDSAIEIVQKIHRMVGTELMYGGRLGSRGDRRRVYVYFPPEDGRGEVFEAWLKRDTDAKAERESVVREPMAA